MNYRYKQTKQTLIPAGAYTGRAEIGTHRNNIVHWEMRECKSLSVGWGGRGANWEWVYRPGIQPCSGVEGGVGGGKIRGQAAKR